MTTEDDFQAALDRDPKDWQTRLVFADWLDDRGDARGQGYRALGHLRLCPWTNENHVDALGPAPRQWGWVELDAGKPYGSHLPFSWIARLADAKAVPLASGVGTRYASQYPTRRQADDDAATAFARLSPHQKARYLKS